MDLSREIAAFLVAELRVEDLPPFLVAELRVEELPPFLVAELRVEELPPFFDFVLVDVLLLACVSDEPQGAADHLSSADSSWYLSFSSRAISS